MRDQLEVARAGEQLPVARPVEAIAIVFAGSSVKFGEVKLDLARPDDSALQHAFHQAAIASARTIEFGCSCASFASSRRVSFRAARAAPICTRIYNSRSAGAEMAAHMRGCECHVEEMNAIVASRFLSRTR